MRNSKEGGSSGNAGNIKSLWHHDFKEPNWCRGVFSYTPGKLTRLVFPTYVGGKVGRLCVEVKEESLLIHAPKDAEVIMSEALKSLKSVEAPSLLNALRTLFKVLLSHYHEELSTLDNETEELIHGMMRGKVRHKPIYRLYDRAARLHRGVHGLIYALQRLDNVYPELRDLTDEAIMLENMLSTTIDRIVQAFNLYYTLVGERTNYVVTKLTVISAIFLPLTLIAGIYGMNFKYMPELSHPLGYPATLATMAAIALGELIYFKKKGWI